MALYERHVPGHGTVDAFDFADPVFAHSTGLDSGGESTGDAGADRR